MLLYGFAHNPFGATQSNTNTLLLCVSRIFGPNFVRFSLFCSSLTLFLAWFDGLNIQLIEDLIGITKQNKQQIKGANDN